MTRTTVSSNVDSEPRNLLIADRKIKGREEVRGTTWKMSGRFRNSRPAHELGVGS